VRRKSHGYPTTSASAAGRSGGRISLNQLLVGDFTGGLVENGQQVSPLPRPTTDRLRRMGMTRELLFVRADFPVPCLPRFYLPPPGEIGGVAQAFAEVAKFRIDA
jgi:hypothetical protein